MNQKMHAGEPGWMFAEYSSGPDACDKMLDDAGGFRPHWQELCNAVESLEPARFAQQ